MSDQDEITVRRLTGFSLGSCERSILLTAPYRGTAKVCGDGVPSANARAAERLECVGLVECRGKPDRLGRRPVRLTALGWAVVVLLRPTLETRAYIVWENHVPSLVRLMNGGGEA
jgi:hypothetical protein